MTHRIAKYLSDCPIYPSPQTVPPHHPFSPHIHPQNPLPTSPCIFSLAALFAIQSQPEASARLIGTVSDLLYFEKFRPPEKSTSLRSPLLPLANIHQIRPRKDNSVVESNESDKNADVAAAMGVGEGVLISLSGRCSSQLSCKK